MNCVRKLSECPSDHKWDGIDEKCIPYTDCPNGYNLIDGKCIKSKLECELVTSINGTCKETTKNCTTVCTSGFQMGLF